MTAAADTGIVYRDRDRYELYGHVRLTDNGTVLTCRRAVYERIAGRGDFFGDVRLVDGDVVGTGRRGESRDGGRLMRLIGDALLVTPDYTVRADTVERDRVTGMGEAFGHVRSWSRGRRTWSPATTPCSWRRTTWPRRQRIPCSPAASSRAAR